MRQKVDFDVCFSPITFTILPIPWVTFLMDKENELATKYMQKFEFSDFCKPEIQVRVQLFYLFTNEIRRGVFLKNKELQTYIL